MNDEELLRSVNNGESTFALEMIRLLIVVSHLWASLVWAASVKTFYSAVLIDTPIFHPVKAVMVILTYSTSKKYGVLDV